MRKLSLRQILGRKVGGNGRYKRWLAKHRSKLARKRLPKEGSDVGR